MQLRDIKDIWRILTNQKTHWENAFWPCYRDWRRAEDRAALAERDLGFAQAAIRELKNQLPIDHEAQRKAASDDIGDNLIADMHAHPEKYIGG